MLLSIDNRVPLFACIFAVGFFLPVAAHPERIEAAGAIGETFDYGVYVKGRRIQVTSAPILVAAGQTIRIQGWALDARTMKPGAFLLYALDGGAPTRVSGYPLPRPDVAAALGVPTAAKSGFVLPINLAGLRQGPHRFHFTLSTSDAAMTALPTDVQITITKK